MHQLDSSKPFSQSKLWELQARYYAERGIQAWRTGEVPHYVTSNPAMGKTYAELVYAFLCDLGRKGQTQETVYLLELGAGHGRLCYHFWKNLEVLLQAEVSPVPSLCYILSDMHGNNQDFWHAHPRLQPYFEKGWIDFAVYDATQPAELQLALAKTQLSTNSLSQPLIAIANYFFDSIPQELFFISEQEIYPTWVSLEIPATAKDASPKEMLKHIQVNYEVQAATENPYAEPYLKDLLDHYAQTLRPTHLLFPDTGIRCLHHLRQLSQQGLLLLTADKGSHRATALDRRHPPTLAKHGSFSLSVNYHALKSYCQSEKGLPLFPKHHTAYLQIGCLLFVSEPTTFRGTQLAFDRFVNTFGPDDYFSLKKFLEGEIPEMDFRTLMASIRLSGYDARLFLQLAPQLESTLVQLTSEERWGLFQTLILVWDLYFPLGEQQDLAFTIGGILYELAFFEEAIRFFDLSAQLYGPQSDVLFNQALCHAALNRPEVAKEVIQALLKKEPAHPDAQQFLAQLQAPTQP